jgi:hypothetical protein
LPIYNRDPATNRNLFNWEEVPGKDNDKLIDFLKNGYKDREFVGMYGKDRVNIHKIEKIDNNTINIYYEKTNLSMKINNEKNDMNITIYGLNFWNIDHMEIDYKNGSIYGMSYAKPEIYYHLIILQLFLWYIFSAFIFKKYASSKKIILKNLLYFFVGLGILLLILKNGMFFFVIMSILLVSYLFINRNHYSETLKNARYATILTFASYPWALFSVNDIVYPPAINYLLLLYIIIIIGVFAGKLFHNPFQLGIIIYLIPFVIGAIFTVLDQDLVARILMNSKSLLTLLLIDLGTVLISSFLILAISNDEAKNNIDNK